MLRGYVARVILLFYLTPVWSTLLARAFLGDRITKARLVTIALGLIGMFVVFGLVWMPLVLWLTMFGGSRLEPGRVAVLLMLEVVIGLVSAAALTHEPFGPREFVGAIFIVGACGAELFARRSVRTADALQRALHTGTRAG